MNNIQCKYPQDIIDKKKRIIVIGDIHADYQKLFDIFIKLKLINLNKVWIAQPKDTVVIQMGDQLDGGGRSHYEADGEIKILDFLDEIHEQANLYNGGVYSILGNHELMNVLGDFRYVSEKDLVTTGGTKMRKQIFSPGNTMAQRFACTRNVIIKVGSFVFVHAGILPSHLEKNTDIIKNINSLMRNYLYNKNQEPTEDFRKYFMNSDSLLWNRQYGNDVNCQQLNSVLRYLKVGHMIVGHTPQKTINSKCDNKIWRVDVGISNAFNGKNVEVLEILDDGIKKNNNNNQPYRVYQL